MEPYETHLALGTALAVGLLVGLEREQSRGDSTATLFAGVRTYPIIALIGAIATLLEPASMWIPLVTLGGVIALVSIAYAADVRAGRDQGLTTEASTIATYLLGALSTSHGAVEPMSTRLGLVAGLGVTMTFLLSSKRWFHEIAEKVSRDDFYSTVKFLIVAVVALPMLPDRALGPLDAINPFHLGLMVVMIAGLSFLGYVAMRWLGPRRGLLLGAALGGLVSSTATTMSFATRTKAAPDLAPVAAGAIAIAWSIMMVRVGVLVAIVDPDLLRTLAPPLAAMTIATILGTALTFHRAAIAPENVSHIKNPFELGSAIKFGIVFGLILLATKAAVIYVGDAGLYLASALGGTTDVDAVTLSTSKLATEGLAHGVATTAIVFAVVVNTLVKVGLAAGIGGAALGKRTALTGGLIVVGAAVGLAINAVV